MKAVHIALGILAMTLNGAAGLWGAYCWWKAIASPWFWRILRAGQLSIIVVAALGGVLLLAHKHVSNLHLLYGLLPLAVSFIGEQLRISAATMILDTRGFASAQEVGELPPEDQRAIVVAVVRREIGVMALAALVIVALLARAAGTA